MKVVFTKYPLFLYFLSLFFVLHGYTENFGITPLAEAFVLLLKYTSFAIILSFIFWIFYKNYINASFIVFLIMAYNFFFGKLHDVSKTFFQNSFVTRYSFILSASLLALILLIVYFKKTNKRFQLITKYLNWLFLILILIDAADLTFKLSKNYTPSTINLPLGFTDCNNCPKPDIYLILADEYAGESELRDIFNFDNTPFLSELKKRNFHVISNSVANYNLTEYSMASLLDMNYLAKIPARVNGLKDLSEVLTNLKKNRTLEFFLSQGYSFYNYSIFDFNQYPSQVTPTFLPLKTTPITSQTFINRIRRDLGYHLATNLKIRKIFSAFYYTDLHNNSKVYKLTKSIASKHTNNPKFIYTHLVMPHYRYYFDKRGQPTSLEKIINDDYCKDKTAYIEYLQYANEKLLALIDYIKKSSAKPPIIILMSDHGYRQFNKSEQVDRKYHFMNLNSVFIPDGNYEGFYDSLSNVNQFRVLLNSQFSQNLPLLKDSISFIH